MPTAHVNLPMKMTKKKKVEDKTSEEEKKTIT